MSIKLENNKPYFPLTHAQKRIYYDDIIYPDAPWANIGFLVRYKEVLDFNLLAKSINTVIKNNDGFRLRLIEKEYEPEPFQYVAPFEEINIDVFDFSGAGGKQDLRNWLDMATQKPFQLLDNNLFYFACLMISPEESGYYMKVHHTISDGWSCFLFFMQVNEAYEKLVAGETLDTSLKPSYINYIRDEKEYLESKNAQSDKHYWHQKLLPLPKPVDLSSKKGNPSNIEANRLVQAFPDELRTLMHNYCGDHHSSLYKLVLSALTIYISSVTGLEDIVIGGVNHGRSKSDYYKIMGMFVSTLSVRNKIDGNTSFRQLVDNIGNNTNEIIKKHSKYPFDRLAFELREESGAEVGFLRNVTLIGHTDVKKERFDYDYIFPGFEPGALLIHLNISNKDKDGILEMEWIYQVEQFRESDIRRFHQGLENVLSNALSDPSRKLAEIDLLKPADKKQLLFDFNKTKVEYPAEKTIHELFEEQVNKTPGDIAVVFQDDELTYQQLDEKASRLAHMLRGKGIGPDEIVGVMVSRSLQMMVSLLGVLKAGGAYVPIDPGYPIERIEFYMSDSNARILLSQEEIIRKFEEKGSDVEGIDVFDEQIYSEDKSRPVNSTSPHNLAYIIYTSGSTGKPKGVAIRHRNAVNFFKGMTDMIDFSPGKTIIALTTVSFDIFLLETLLPVTVGVKVVVANEKQQKDPELLKQIIVDAKINILQATPARLKLLLSSSSDFECLEEVEAVLVGGEPFPEDLFESLKEYYRGKIIDVYGPTETTVWSTMQNLTGKEKIDIGIPIANTQVYIVDKYMRLQPVGVTGELYIGGDGVARGYLNRPELTAERFIANPFTEADDPDRPYKEIYQTGDLARWLPNGDIECLGRIDHQVKIRGFRIETGEIENQITKQTDQKIEKAVVMARDDTSGEKFLCAYIVADQKIDVHSLENTLSASLLDYMIPSYFIQVEDIPLTPNGKVDRKRLPDPKIKARGESYTAPRDDVEIALANIWAELLHIDDDIIGIDDSFFKLGGHSLKAAVMNTKIHKLLSVKVLMHEIFDMPSIRKLAEHIRGSKIEEFTTIQLAGEKEFYPLAPAQRRMYFMDQLDEQNSTLYNIQLMDIYCKGLVKEQLEHAFRMLIKRHESLRTSFHTREGGAVQKIHHYDDVIDNFKIEYYETREKDGMIHSHEEGKEWTKVTGVPLQDVVEHFVKPFDLTRPPLLRAALVKVSGMTNILMVDMHHIMSDGVSLVILVRDLWKLYDDDKDLPELNIQYKDYAEWFLDIVEQERDELEKYWLGEFSGDIPVLSLPVDYSRPAKRSFEGDLIYFDIGKEETEKLNNIAKKQGTTLFMVLLSVYYVLLTKLSGQDDIVVGTFHASRGHADLLDLIGMFVGTLALRNYPSGEKSFKTLLKDVKEKTLSAFENQDYPLDELVGKVAPNHEINRNPLFDVTFGLENEADKTEEYLLEVLMLDKNSPYHFNVRKSKFDIMLMGAEKENTLQFGLEYSTSLFKEETIERFIRYYKKIVNTICDEGIDRKISEISIISLEEKMDTIYILNDSAAAHPRDKTIQQFFEEHVEKTPGNTALKYHDDTMTYRRLNEKANQLARLLRGKGVEPDGLVGVMTERSFEMLIGIYAIQKAGGAYLPIDPNYPEDRVMYLFKDSSSHLLLTQRKHIEFARTVQFEGEIIDLDELTIYQGEDQNLYNVNSPGDLAYIIYTSGSTGKPKGVTIEHVSAVNLLLALDKMYPLEESDAYLLKTAFLFDVSVSEIFGWFWRGGSMVILEQGGEKDPSMMIDIIEKEGITHLNFVPSMFNLFVDMLGPENINKLSGLRYIFLAGEAIWPDSIIKFRELGTDVIIENIYGPTEATVYSSWYPVAKWQGAGSVSIGKPVDNTKLYILGTGEKGWNSMKPVGIPGELTISGIQLSRGYLNRPELTAQMFISNPYAAAEPSDKTYKKLYRTGDLCRWNNDGNIEYMGRIDFQVKVRGFRIELGEIETELSKIDEIKEGVVIARENKERKGDKYLCAYFVADKKVDISTVRERLAEELPEYMVPSYFMQLDAIPLNPSGKIDRKLLPEPEAQILTVDYAAPTTEIEHKLANLWAEVLNLEKVGIDDNFFEIGGDSLKTILITGKLKKQNIHININEFFSSKTIRELAKRITSRDETLHGEDRLPPTESQRREKMDEKEISRNIKSDYTAYLKKAKSEEWPDLKVENNYKNILLTGATGYLGAYLAHALLKETDAVLFLPIRGKSQEVAEERFKKKMDYYFGSGYSKSIESRVIIKKADLTENRLGLDKSVYDNWCNIIDSVIHSAANVKHYGDYSELQKDNVTTTEKLLEFALISRNKDFHFISTLDTGRGAISGKDYLVFTEYIHDAGQKSDHVYIKSKFEAEKKVLSYRQKGLNASIYRAGNVTFHSQSGHFQENIENNAFYAIMKGISKVGLLSPDMRKLTFDMSFVDYASRAIVELLNRRELKNETYHISNPNKFPISELIRLLKETGIPVPEVKDENIVSHLSQFEGNKEYEEIIERVKIDSWAWEGKEETMTVPKEDRTVILLEKLGFQWPRVNKKHIDKMIAHCKEVGFL